MGQQENVDGMKLEELILLLHDSATTGAKNALAELPLIKRISKSDAYRRYGRANVDRWAQEGLLRPDNLNDTQSPNIIDIAKLEAVAAFSNRGTYLPVAER